MSVQELRCVLVIDAAQPRGLAANTAAILGITLGQLMPEVVGVPVSDQDGHEHAGIIEFPVPVLAGTPERLREIRSQLYTPEFADVAAADFTELAQTCRTYSELIDRMAACPEAGLQYLAIGLCGPAKKVSRLTGNLPLLR